MQPLYQEVNDSGRACAMSDYISDLKQAIDAYIAELGRQNASPHTLRNYAADLKQFAEYFTPPGEQTIAPGEMTPLLLREWLGSQYSRELTAVTIRRRLAAVRSLFKFMLREGMTE